MALDDNITRFDPGSGSVYYRTKEEIQVPHRMKGPAVIRKDGHEYWYKNGLLHRVNGPAVIYPDGTEFWLQEGELHRLDGPAVTYADGGICWYIEGTGHTYREFREKTNG